MTNTALAQLERMLKSGKTSKKQAIGFFNGITYWCRGCWPSDVEKKLNKIKKLTPEFLMAAVKFHGDLIYNMPNQTEELQLAAIEQNVKSYDKIFKPTARVTSHPKVVKYLEAKQIEHEKSTQRYRRSVGYDSSYNNSNSSSYSTQKTCRWQVYSTYVGGRYQQGKRAYTPT